MSNGLEGLVGKDLSGFKIVEMMEAYRTDVDGRFAGSLGFFRSPKIAAAFVGNQGSPEYCGMKPSLVLTDGVVGYEMKSKEPVKLFDDEQEALKLKSAALAKLSPADRMILGYK